MLPQFRMCHWSIEYDPNSGKSSEATNPDVCWKCQNHDKFHKKGGSKIVDSQ